MSKCHYGSGRIGEVECIHEDGKFILCNFQEHHHGVSDLFTVRFRAPADYQAGNVLVLRGKVLPVLTPGMQSAPAGVFRAGGVVHADIDLACGRAFVGTGGSGGGSGTETDPVYTADKPSLAPLASPALTGIPTAPTAASGTATTQLATTEFVATAIEEADTTPSVAFAMVPDYAAQDSTNQMPADGSSFTVPADGFVVVSRDGAAAARQSVMVDGVEAAGAAGSVSATLPVSAGDVVTASGAGWTAGSCYYVPPKYVPVNRQYSTDEQLTGETWIDGKPIYQRTLKFVNPALLNDWNPIASFGVGVISDIVDIKGSITTANGLITLPLPYTSVNNTIAGISFNRTSGYFQTISYGTTGVNANIVATIYYTKL